MKLLPIFFSTLCFSNGVYDMNFLRGKWFSIFETNATSYFHVKDSSIYAVMDTAKVRMDVTRIWKEDGMMKLHVQDLKILSTPKNMNIFDFRVYSFIRVLMKHGMNLHLEHLPNSTTVVHWAVEEEDTVKRTVHHKGEVSLFRKEVEDL